LPESNDNDDNEDVGQHEAQIDLENEENAVKYEMADGRILRKRRRQKVLRYVRYNKESDPANYYRSSRFISISGHLTADSSDLFKECGHIGSHF